MQICWQWCLACGHYNTRKNEPFFFTHGERWLVMCRCESTSLIAATQRISPLHAIFGFYKVTEAASIAHLWAHRCGCWYPNHCHTHTSVFVIVLIRVIFVCVWARTFRLPKIVYVCFSFEIRFSYVWPLWGNFDWLGNCSTLCLACAWNYDILKTKTITLTHAYLKRASCNLQGYPPRDWT